MGEGGRREQGGDDKGSVRAHVNLHYAGRMSALRANGKVVVQGTVLQAFKDLTFENIGENETIS
nr:hypothetical protein [Methylocapsa sp. RX1]